MTATMDCTECKFYVAEADEFLGQLPMCGADGTPLGISANDSAGTRRAIARSNAASCGRSVPLASSTSVTISSTRSHTVGASTNLTRAMRLKAEGGPEPTSCAKCTWYIPPKVAHDELGFDFGVCGVFAELIGNKELQPKAKACDVGVAGPNRTSSDGIMLDPKFDAGVFVLDVNDRENGKYDPAYHSSIDPREYVSDRPVTAEDIESGIRAWRKVNDPTGEAAPLYMPIFDWTAIGCTRDPRLTYGDHQPDLYVDHAGLLHTFAFLYMGDLTKTEDASGRERQVALNETLALIGGSGTGKTEFFCWVAWLMDLPFTRISLSPSTDPIEFFGMPSLGPNEEGMQVTGFKRGRFSLKYEQSGVIVLDEANSASDSIWFTLRSALDSAGQFAIEAEGVVLEKDPYCFIGIAMNPDDPAYRGVRPLGAADYDRLAKTYVELPDIDTERDIVRRHCEKIGYDVPEGILSLLSNVSVRLRQMHANGDITVPWTIRSNVRVAKCTMGLGVERAFRVAVTDGLRPDQAELILTVVRSYL